MIPLTSHEEVLWVYRENPLAGISVSSFSQVNIRLPEVLLRRKLTLSFDGSASYASFSRLGIRVRKTGIPQHAFYKQLN